MLAPIMRYLSVAILLFVAACATDSATPDEGERSVEPSGEKSEAATSGEGRADERPADAEAPEVECDMWEVTEAVGRATPAFQNCYESAVEKTPELAERGTVELLLEWHVRADGTTTRVGIVESEADSPPLHRCLKREADALHLPDLADRACLARHGFRFTP